MTALVSSLSRRGFTAGSCALGRFCESRWRWLAGSGSGPLRSALNEFLGFVDSVVSLAF